MAFLILVRHGESEWNAKGLWTGWTDIGLSEKGKLEAKQAGEKIKNIPIDIVYNSKLIRAKQTWEEIEKVLQIHNISTFEHEALNERDYGIYTGKNKWQIQKELGEEEFKKLRRSFDYPLEKGESLKDVFNRVVPYYKSEILPKLKEGKNVLISAHGNSLRALVKYLDNIPDDKISELEIPTGQVLVYTIEADGKITSKKIL